MIPCKINVRNYMSLRKGGKFMGYPQRNDNIAQNMAREVNLLEHERQHEAAKPVSGKQQKIGKIAFGVVLFLLALIVLLFIF